MKKFELENIFYENCAPECSVLTRELIKKLISVTEPVEDIEDIDASTAEMNSIGKESGAEVKMPVIEFLLQHGVDSDDFAAGLETNIKGNWFDIYYSDFALKPFSSWDIESVIKKKPDQFQTLVTQVVWCGLKGCAGERLEQSVAGIEVSEEDYSEVIGICKKVAVALMEKHEFHYNDFSVFDEYADMFELESLLVQLIQVCNLLVSDMEKEEQGYKKYLCKNFYPSLSGNKANNADEYLPDRFICREIITSLDLPGSPDECFRKLMTLALLFLMDRSSKIQVNLNKFGLMVLRFIQEDNNYIKSIFGKQEEQGVISGIHENNNITVNLKKLIGRCLKKSHAITDTEEDILHEVYLKLLNNKITRYRFMQSLNTFLYNIIREVIAKAPPPPPDHDGKSPGPHEGDHDDLKFIYDACYELLEQIKVLDDFDNNAKTFIDQASRQRKSIDFKFTVIFAKSVNNKSDQQIFDKWKQDCKKKQNIKVIRNRIKKSLSKKYELFIKGNNKIRPFRDILSEHLNKITERHKKLKWNYRVDHDSIIKGLTFHYLNGIRMRLKAMFDDEAFSICKQEVLKLEWPISSKFVKDIFEII